MRFCCGKGVIDNILHEIIYDIQKITFLKESEWGKTNLMRLLLEVVDVHKQSEYGNIAEEPHSVKCCLCHGRGVIANILHELISEIQWQVDIFHGGFTSREMSDHRSKGDQEIKCGANQNLQTSGATGGVGAHPGPPPMWVSRLSILNHFLKSFVHLYI